MASNKLRDDDNIDETKVPLLDHSPSGNSSTIQTLGNIIVSIVGTGILGLPYAFRVAGWFTGLIGVSIAGIVTFYCMILLVKCKEKLSEDPRIKLKTYGDLGQHCLGNTGHFLVDLLIFTSQCGGSIAYLVFIGQNLSAIFHENHLSSSAFIFMLVPIEIALSWIGSLSSLAPFSIFADLCNILAIGMVVKEDIRMAMNGHFRFRDRRAIASHVGGLAFASGMAVFCFEGFAVTLPLEASMKERKQFPGLLAKAFSGITIVYILFGLSGYMAYGDTTKDIITLNLPQKWTTYAIQIGLCLGLIFTFPIMIHPVHEIVEERLRDNGFSLKVSRGSAKVGIYAYRAILIIVLALVASFVPGFGVFSSLVGSTVCALIAFVLPALFHLRLLGPTLSFWEKGLDYIILFCGLLFAVYGTSSTVSSVP